MKTTSRYNAYEPDACGHIHYSADDDAVWHDLIIPQRARTDRYCSRIFRSGLDSLQLSDDRIPQCSEVSERLEAATGWRVTPVPALISFDRFYALLADRRFPAASFIRARDEMDYLQEPDIFHEIFGHTPLLANPQIAEFSHRIGQLGCRARPEDHVWLARLYWFTVEFGLIREDGRIRALGAGLASSASELPYAVDGDIALRQPFDLLEVLRTPTASTSTSRSILYSTASNSCSN
ncbi:phenylalanine 4-monooxygenase [Marinobacterium aestuariivivens]|uniref:Phenylalanine 4-monooxygenase n=1 Tax=Marinobacterium aestuariivivens TaxID=1698799 RepID=A0ABW2A140_9GAMM